MSAPPVKPPEILDKIVDLVLAHRPKPKPKDAKRPKRGSYKKVQKNKNAPN
jgi:hypothetical protein